MTQYLPSPAQQAQLMLLDLKLVWNTNLGKFSVFKSSANKWLRRSNKYTPFVPDKEYFYTADDAIKYSATVLHDANRWV